MGVATKLIGNLYVLYPDLHHSAHTLIYIAFSGIGCAAYTGYVGSLLTAFTLDLKHDIAAFDSWNIPSINDKYDGPFDPPGFVVFLCWIGIFGLHHSLFARGWVAQWVVTIIPPALERSFYILVSSLLLHGMMVDPRIYFGGGTVWNIIPWTESHFLIRNAVALLLSSYFYRAIFQLGGLSLIGIPQSFEWNKKQCRDKTLLSSPRLQHFELVTTGCYGLVRHPLQTAVLWFVWCHPFMTLQRFVYAVAFTIYILIGINLEEKECVNMFGVEYTRYQRTTPQLIPFINLCPFKSRRGRPEISLKFN